jgi:hypothetical protein
MHTKATSRQARYVSPATPDRHSADNGVPRIIPLLNLLDGGGGERTISFFVADIVAEGKSDYADIQEYVQDDNLWCNDEVASHRTLLMVHRWTAFNVLILQDIEAPRQLEDESAITSMCRMTKHE